MTRMAIRLTSLPHLTDINKEMIRKQCYAVALLLGFLTVIAACSSDKGNYNYRNLNEVQIGLADSYSVLIRDRLTIVPQLSASSGTMAPNDYIYEWKVYDEGGAAEPVVIGQTAQLDYYVSLLPGNYTLVFTVQEKEANVFYRHEAQLEVKTTTSHGWLVLCNEKDRVRLDMISHVTGETYYDLLKGTELEYWQEPRQLVYASDMAEPYYLVAGSGTTRLSNNEFSWNESYLIENEFAGGQFAGKVAFMANNWPGKIIIDEARNAYYCSTLMGDGLFGDVRRNETGTQKKYVAGYNALEQQHLPFFLLWDYTYRNFVVCADQFASIGLDSSKDMPVANLPAIGFPVVNDDLFDWPNRQNGAAPYGVEVEVENTRYDKNQSGQGMTYALLHNSTFCHLYGVILGNLVCLTEGSEKYGYAYEKSYYADLSSCTDIIAATHFAASSLKTMLYYAVGGKVYAVNFASGTPEARLQIDLGDEEITLLKFNLFQGDDPDNRTYDLIVGSTTADGEGVVRIYDGFDSEGDFTGLQPEEMGRGFAPIVDVIYCE